MFTDYWRKHLGAAKLLTREQEYELGQKALHGDLAARDAIVSANLRLVAKIASEYGGAMDAEDAFSYGVLGLIRAAEKFEPARNNRFCTYAVAWIKAYIRKGMVADNRVVKVDTTQKFRSIEATLPKVQVFLQHRLGREPTSEELASWLGCKLAELENYFARAQASVSLDLEHEANNNGGQGTLHDFVADQAPRQDERLEKATATSILTARMRWALSHLDERERRIIETRYLTPDDGLVMTFDALGRELGFSRERARQLEVRAMAKLRLILENKDTPIVKTRKPAKIIELRRCATCGGRVNRHRGALRDRCVTCRRAPKSTRKNGGAAC